MPTILVKIPPGSFPGDSRAALGRELSAAASRVEQMADDPRAQFLCWVVIDEIAAGNWTCGGADAGARWLPCVAIVYVPEGVLDTAARVRYVQQMHAAFQAAMPADDRRQLASSVVLQDVPDATWGASGALWTLADFTAASGYAHLLPSSQPVPA